MTMHPPASVPGRPSKGNAGLSRFVPVARAWLTAAALTTTAFAYGQALDLRPALAAGQAFALTSTKTREQTEAGRTVFRARAETPVEVRVREATPETWVLDWTFGDTRVVEPAGMAPPPDAALLDGITLRLRFDRSGRPPVLENYPEVQQRVAAKTKALLQAFPDNAQRRQLAVLLSDSVGSQERIEQMVLPDIAHYFLPFTAPLDRAAPQRRETQLPSPVNGEPLRALEELTVVRYEPQGPDPAARVAVVQWTQTMEPAETARMLRELGERLRERARMTPGASVPVLPPSLDVRVDGRYEVPLEGMRLPATAEVRRRSAAGSSTMSDTLRYVRTR
jgi:hypothetical protein